MCIIYSIEATILFDMETARKFSELAKFDPIVVRDPVSQAPIRDPKLVQRIRDMYEEEYEKLIDKIRIRLFILNAVIIFILVWYLYKRSSFSPKRSLEKLNLEKYLKEKYGLEISEKMKKDIKLLNQKILEYRKKKIYL